MPAERFPPEIHNRLQFYVYRLIDPRNGETFYVGKGQENRVFNHAAAKIDETDPSEKMRRIREIQAAGFSVIHVIHRHGMNEKTAFEVEAALMDAYPGLTNIAGGVGSLDFGVMHADEIINRYAAEEADFKDRALIIKINRTAMERSIYEAVRYCWTIDVQRAQRAEVILAVFQGIIIGAFVADKWLEATTGNFPGRDESPGKYGFNGREANEELKAKYIGKRIPAQYRNRGAATPIRYTWR